MIIARTPYRISFFGGGTDYPSWYRKYNGQVLSTSIDKYIYISCRYLPPFFQHRLRLVYSKIEECNDIGELKHPSVREVLKYMNVKEGLEIHYDGDLPGRSGIGSSSAFTVGLLNAINKFKNIDISKEKLAKESINIEQNIIKETVGSQDQIASAYGGFNHIKFSTDNKFSVNSINIKKNNFEYLQNNLMLFYTGIKRTASEVAKSFIDNFENKKNNMQMIYNMVNEGIDILNNDAIDDFGKLLDKAWNYKKELSGLVSNDNIEDIYKEAKLSGALGGKISGAGGGGFLLLYVPLNKQNVVKKRLNKLLHIPFCFDNTGSKIIYHDVHKRYIEEEKFHKKNMYTPFTENEDVG